MRILCTGSAGFIGSHLVDELIHQGHTVFGIDNLSIGSEKNISPEAKRNFYKCDLRRRDMTHLIMRIARPQIVYHAAAWAHEGLSQFCPTLIMENNMTATMNILTASIKQKVKRFIYFSSMAVYGEQIPPFNEKMPRKPVDIYGIMKTACENSIEVLCRVHDIEYTILRLHNVIGIRQNMSDPYRNVVAIFMNRLLQNKPFYIYGNGEQRRSFSNIQDAIPSIVEAGFKNVAGEIINIGPSRDYSLNDLANSLLKISGKSDLNPIYVLDRPVEVKNAFCTNDKAEKLLGYKDSISLQDGLREMWEWAKSEGYQEPKYLPHLELQSDKIPITWREKKI